MFEDSLFKLLLAVVKQAYKDAAKGSTEARSFIKYLQGDDSQLPYEQLSLF